MKEFSKQMAFLSWMPFIFVLGFTFYLFVDPSYQFDDTTVTVLIAMHTASASISATTNVFYLRKSQAENTYKVKLSLYENATKIHIDEQKALLELQRIYGELPMGITDDMVTDALNDLTEHVDSVMNDATQPIEKEEV